MKWGSSAYGVGVLVHDPLGVIEAACGLSNRHEYLDVVAEPRRSQRRVAQWVACIGDQHHHHLAKQTRG
jgi:hypothetical protein